MRYHSTRQACRAHLTLQPATTCLLAHRVWSPMRRGSRRCGWAMSRCAATALPLGRYRARCCGRAATPRRWRRHDEPGAAGGVRPRRCRLSSHLPSRASWNIVADSLINGEVDAMSADLPVTGFAIKLSRGGLEPATGLRATLPRESMGNGGLRERPGLCRAQRLLGARVARCNRGAVRFGRIRR
jgi:hypothetical protein